MTAMEIAPAVSPVVQAAISKCLLSPNLSANYSAVFEKCADWFAPTNRNGDEYSLAQVLHGIGLLDARRICRHRGGCFRGYRVEFKQSAGASA